MLWKDKYELGVPISDAQHRELFQRVGGFLKNPSLPGLLGGKGEQCQ